MKKNKKNNSSSMFATLSVFAVGAYYTTNPELFSLGEQAGNQLSEKSKIPAAFKKDKPKDLLGSTVSSFLGNKQVSFNDGVRTSEATETYEKGRKSPTGIMALSQKYQKLNQFKKGLSRWATNTKRSIKEFSKIAAKSSKYKTLFNSGKNTNVAVKELKENYISDASFDANANNGISNTNKDEDMKNYLNSPKAISDYNNGISDDANNTSIDTFGQTKSEYQNSKNQGISLKNIKKNKTNGINSQDSNSYFENGKILPTYKNSLITNGKITSNYRSARDNGISVHNTKKTINDYKSDESLGNQKFLDFKNSKSGNIEIENELTKKSEYIAVKNSGSDTGKATGKNTDGINSFYNTGRVSDSGRNDLKTTGEATSDYTSEKNDGIDNNYNAKSKSDGINQEDISSFYNIGKTNPSSILALKNSGKTTTDYANKKTLWASTNLKNKAEGANSNTGLNSFDTGKIDSSNKASLISEGKNNDINKNTGLSKSYSNSYYNTGRNDSSNLDFFKSEGEKTQNFTNEKNNGATVNAINYTKDTGKAAPHADTSYLKGRTSNQSQLENNYKTTTFYQNKLTNGINDDGNPAMTKEAGSDTTGGQAKYNSGFSDATNNNLFKENGKNQPDFSTKKNKGATSSGKNQWINGDGQNKYNDGLNNGGKATFKTHGMISQSIKTYNQGILSSESLSYFNNGKSSTSGRQLLLSAGKQNSDYNTKIDAFYNANSQLFSKDAFINSQDNTVISNNDNLGKDKYSKYYMNYITSNSSDLVNFYKNKSNYNTQKKLGSDNYYSPTKEEGASHSGVHSALSNPSYYPSYKVQSKKTQESHGENQQEYITKRDNGIAANYNTPTIQDGKESNDANDLYSKGKQLPNSQTLLEQEYKNSSDYIVNKNNGANLGTIKRSFSNWLDDDISTTDYNNGANLFQPELNDEFNASSDFENKVNNGYNSTFPNLDTTQKGFAHKSKQKEITSMEYYKKNSYNGKKEGENSDEFLSFAKNQVTEDDGINDKDSTGDFLNFMGNKSIPLSSKTRKSSQSSIVKIERTSSGYYTWLNIPAGGYGNEGFLKAILYPFLNKLDKKSYHPEITSKATDIFEMPRLPLSNVASFFVDQLANNLPAIKRFYGEALFNGRGEKNAHLYLKNIKKYFYGEKPTLKQEVTEKYYKRIAKRELKKDLYDNSFYNGVLNNKGTNIDYSDVEQEYKNHKILNFGNYNGGGAALKRYRDAFDLWKGNKANGKNVFKKSLHAKNQYNAGTDLNPISTNLNNYDSNYKYQEHFNSYINELDSVSMSRGLKFYLSQSTTINSDFNTGENQYRLSSYKNDAQYELDFVAYRDRVENNETFSNGFKIYLQDEKSSEDFEIGTSGDKGGLAYNETGYLNSFSFYYDKIKYFMNTTQGVSEGKEFFKNLSGSINKYDSEGLPYTKIDKFEKDSQYETKFTNGTLSNDGRNEYKKIANSKVIYDNSIDTSFTTYRNQIETGNTYTNELNFYLNTQDSINYFNSGLDINYLTSADFNTDYQTYKNKVESGETKTNGMKFYLNQGQSQVDYQDDLDAVGAYLSSGQYVTDLYEYNDIVKPGKTYSIGREIYFANADSNTDYQIGKTNKIDSDFKINPNYLTLLDSGLDSNNVAKDFYKNKNESQRDFNAGKQEDGQVQYQASADFQSDFKDGRDVVKTGETTSGGHKFYLTQSQSNTDYQAGLSLEGTTYDSSSSFNTDFNTGENLANGKDAYKASTQSNSDYQSGVYVQGEAPYKSNVQYNSDLDTGSSTKTNGINLYKNSSQINSDGNSVLDAEFAKTQNHNNKITELKTTYGKEIYKNSGQFSIDYSTGNDPQIRNEGKYIRDLDGQFSNDLNTYFDTRNKILNVYQATPVSDSDYQIYVGDLKDESHYLSSQDKTNDLTSGISVFDNGKELFKKSNFVVDKIVRTKDKYQDSPAFILDAKAYINTTGFNFFNQFFSKDRRDNFYASGKDPIGVEQDPDAFMATKDYIEQINNGSSNILNGRNAFESSTLAQSMFARFKNQNR